MPPHKGTGTDRVGSQGCGAGSLFEYLKTCWVGLVLDSPYVATVFLVQIVVPRTSRASVGRYCYHAINRGNERPEVFHKAKDYQAFLDLIGEACERLPLRVTGFCLMPNHFHLVLWPHGDGDLSRWMQWLMTSHVRRYHRHYGTSGHVWQGRFKAFPIEDDEHYLTVL